MDGHRFDALTKRLATTSTRRRLLVMLGGLAGMLRAGDAAAQSGGDGGDGGDVVIIGGRCRRAGAVCTGNGQCCSRLCNAATGRCCQPDNAPICAGRCGTVIDNCDQLIACPRCDGCCRDGLCQQGTTNAACGNGGGACVVCESPQTCGGGGQPGVCGCTPESATTTCRGRCGIVTNRCGRPVNCTAICAGCCSAGVCRAGTTNAVCGRDGERCDACESPQTCGGGGQPGVCGCTPENPRTTCGNTCTNRVNNCGQLVDCTATCPTCCYDSLCGSGNGNNACGRGGGQCATCQQPETCGGGGTPGECG